MKRYTNYFLVIALIAMATACSVGSRPGVPISHDLGPIAEQTTDSTAVIIDAPVWLWDERIRYRLLYDDATVIRYYNLDRWEAPLPALLENRLTIAGTRPYSLQIQLTQFEQQFVTVDNAHVVMSLTVKAFTGEGYQLLGKRSFNLSQKTVSPDAAGAIAGFIALTEQVNADIQSWLETLPDA